MTPDPRSPCIVVGYDGSACLACRLARAADRAGEDGQVYIVHAYSVPRDWIGVPDYQRLLDVQLNRAQDLMALLEEQSGADLSDADWDTEVIGDRARHGDRRRRRRAATPTRSSSAPAGTGAPARSWAASRTR